MSLNPVDPVLHWVTRTFGHFAESGGQHLSSLFTTYLYQTVDATSPGHGSITGNPALHRLNGVVGIAADALMVIVVIGVFLHAMFDHGVRSRFSYKVMVPRLLGTVILIHFSLPLMQMAIDLNNVLGLYFLHAGGESAVAPWEAALGPTALSPLTLGQDVFLAVLAVGLVVALCILGLASVIRYALLGVLIVCAPLAALCGVLPETRGYARTWLRLFTATVFMQAVQLLVLGVAIAVGVSGEAVPRTLFSLATLWLMLKVPGAMSTASHLETKAKTLSHGIEKSVGKWIHPAHPAHRTAA